MALSKASSPDHLQEELDSLLKQIYTLHHTEVDLGLERVERFLADWGCPQDHLAPVIHIAGTNGKGSTLAYLLAMAQAGELAAHRYTSPHLINFNERINISGKDIDNKYLLSLIKEGLDINKSQPASFFEFTTALAFKAFADTSSDLVLLETGLGGRLDATNVVKQPDLTIITPIAFDHMEFLGDTLPKIANEKAGIMKQGVPCLIAPQSSQDVYQVFIDRAADIQCPLWLYSRDWHYETDENGFTVHIQSNQYHYPLPSMTGEHQIMNAAVAAAASQISPALKSLTEKDRTVGVQNAFWPARLQNITDIAGLPKGWTVLLDGGHNSGCAQAVASHLEEHGEKVHLVIGMLDNKDPENFMAPLRPYIQSISCVPITSHKPTKAQNLQGKLAKIGLSGECYDDAIKALSAIKDRETEPQTILITGSLYLAGDVLSALEKK